MQLRHVVSCSQPTISFRHLLVPQNVTAVRTTKHALRHYPRLWHNRAEFALGIAQIDSSYEVQPQANMLAALPGVMSNLASILRAALPAPTWCEYLLPLLLLKFLSDEWLATRARLVHQFPAQPEQIARIMARQRIFFPLLVMPRVFPPTQKGRGKIMPLNTQENCLANFDSLYKRRHLADIGAHIDLVLEALENANPNYMQGMFRHLRYNDARRLGNSAQRHSLWHAVLGELARLDLRSTPLRQAFASHWHDLLQGQHWSSQQGQLVDVSTLLHALWQPVGATPFASLCDPFCGDAQLLQHLRDCAQHAYGQEVEAGALASARMSVLLPELGQVMRPNRADQDQATPEQQFVRDYLTLQHGNSLLQPPLTQTGLRQFDLQVSNLCRHHLRWDAQALRSDHWHRFTRGLTAKDKPELLAACHMLASATPGLGKIALLIPPGCLYRAGNEQLLRRQLLQEKTLDAVIMLPSSQRGPHQMALLLFDLARPATGSAEVLLIDASLAPDSARQVQTLPEQLLTKIIDIYHQRQSLDGFSCLVTAAEIRQHADSWLPATYLKAPNIVSNADASILGEEIAQLEQATVLARKRLAKALATL